MKQINKFLLTLLLTGAGSSVALADAYVCGFDMAVDTDNPNFKAASNWKHLADSYKVDSWMLDDNGELKYMSYTWRDGVLSANKQYACSSDNQNYGRAVFDCLITPVVSGKITLDIQTNILASASSPSYVEVYAYDEDANKRGELIKKIDGTSNPELNYSDFTTGIEIADLETPQRLALRLQYVSIDNFSADDAQLVVEKSIKIDSYEAHVIDPTSGTWYWRQNADLSVPVTFTVTVTNNGDADLVQGEENYSISILNNGTGPASEPVKIPCNLAVGETSAPFEVSMTISKDDLEKYWSYSTANRRFILKENLSGAETTTKDSRYQAYESKLVFTLAENTSSLSGSYNAQSFGLLDATASKDYKIRNTGTAPLTINSVTVPEGFTVKCTLPAEGEEASSEPEEITFPYTLVGESNIDVKITLAEIGVHSGNIEINYIPYGKTDVTKYELGLSGTLIAEGTWSWDFNSSTQSTSDILNCPPGAIAGTGVYGGYLTSSNGIYDNHIKCSSTYNYYLTLPKLHANAGDIFSFDLKNDSYNKTFKVYLTTERLKQEDASFQNLTPVFEIESSSLSSSFVPYSFTIEEEGDYYIVMDMRGVQLDNLVGLSLPEDAPDYDIYISKFTTGSNNDVESVQSGKEINPKVEFYALSEIDGSEYDVSLFVDGQKVDSPTTILLTPDAKKTKSFNFSYTPEVENTTEFEFFVRFTFDDDTVIESEKKKVKVTNESCFAFNTTVSADGYWQPTSTSTPISFGTTNDNTLSKTYQIGNWGTKPLTVRSINVPEGFSVDPTSCTVEGKKSQNVKITFSTATAGTYDGDLEIVYVDNDGADQTYTLGISGTMLDPTKWYVNFNDDKWPAGSLAQTNVATYSYGTDSEPNYCFQSTSFETSENRMFVTPLLHAEAGESLNFEVSQGTSTSYACGVRVFAAKDRKDLLKKNEDGEYENATLLGHFSSKDVDEEYLLQYNVYKPFSVTLPEAGDWYIGFEPYYFGRVDNINGLTPVGVANDVLMEGYSIPTEGMQNKVVTGSVSLRSLLNNLEAGSYTVKSYVDGKESMSTEGAAVEVKNKIPTTSDATVVPVSFRSPKAGTFPVYFEVIGEGINLTTEPVEVSFSEEVASAEVIVGAPIASSCTNIPFNYGYQSSQSVSLYPASSLGLSSGDKISSIRIKGFNSGEWTKTVVPKITIYYEWTDDVKQDAVTDHFDPSDLSLIYSKDLHTEKRGDASNHADIFTINLAEPLIYPAGKSLRMVFVSECSDYQNVLTFEVSNSLKQTVNIKADVDNLESLKTGARYYNNSKDQANPILYLDLAVANTSVSGVVVGKDDAPVENAVVRLISEDGDNIQYETTTNADGEYTINVIQNSRDYTIEAIAPDNSGETFDEHVNVADESKTYDLQLLDVVLVSDDADNSGISGQAVIRLQKSLNAGFNVIALPMSLSGEETEAIFGEDAMILELEGETASGAATVVNFVEVESKVMVGGKPYLLWLPGESREAEFRFKGAPAAMETESTDATAFLATDKRTPIADKMFVLAEDNFINPSTARSLRAAGEQTIPAYSGYIKADNAQSVNFTTSAGITTAVEEIELDELENETIYDLNGFRVKNPEKGIYIINGKAVLVK